MDTLVKFLLEAGCSVSLFSMQCKQVRFLPKDVVCCSEICSTTVDDEAFVPCTVSWCKAIYQTYHKPSNTIMFPIHAKNVKIT